MKTSKTGINLIKSFEGCVLKAYQCPAKVWTIGWGHTGTIKQTIVKEVKIEKDIRITQDEADNLLVEDLEKYEKKVLKYDKKYNWTQNEFNALVSFAYNLGSIDQLTALGTRSKSTIAQKMLLYNKSAGKVLAGLTRRREVERILFLTK